MKYDVEGFALEDFLQADKVVRATILANGRVDTWNTIRRVTTNPDNLAKTHRSDVHRSLSNPETIRAYCFTCTNNRYEFDLWFNPRIVSPTNSAFRATVIHELCHGYLGTGHGHGRPWRRLYTRALYHYHTQVHEVEHFTSLVDVMNWQYTKRGKTESTGDFLKRIKADQHTWLKQADQESARVAETYSRMS